MTYSEKRKRLTSGELPTKQALFVQYYLQDDKRNATKAAIHAGYPARSARSKASHILAKPEAQAVIAKHIAAVTNAIQLEKEEACLILASIVKGTHADLQAADGVERIKVAIDAAKTLGKWLNWEAAKKVDVTGSGVGPFYIQIVEHK